MELQQNVELLRSIWQSVPAWWGGGVSGDGGGAGAGGRVQLFHQSKKGLLKGFQNKSTSFKAASVLRFDLPIPIIPSFP